MVLSAQYQTGLMSQFDWTAVVLILYIIMLCRFVEREKVYTKAMNTGVNVFRRELSLLSVFIFSLMM